MNEERIIKGIPAAPGICIGKAYVKGKERFQIEMRKISKENIPKEILRLEEALSLTREEILALKKKIAKEMGEDHAQIFDAHLLFLEDRAFIEDIIERVKKGRVNVEYALQESVKKYVEIFSKIEDEYLRERAYDFQDIGKRLLNNMLRQKKAKEDLFENSIIIAHDLSPSETASLKKDKIIGFVTDIGGRTSHTAILARSLGIPAVIGTQIATEEIKTGDELIIDGSKGEVMINPSPKALEEYKKEREKRKKLTRKYSFTKKLTPVTLDSKEIKILANIEFPEEIAQVLDVGAQGIGLYRTEYFYMNRVSLPSEEEQYRAYKEVAKRLQPFPVTIRTLDLGGDKFLSPIRVPTEMQSFLGQRAIRFCLAHPEVFKTQLRAILRAALEGNLKVMYPMISGVEELIEANKVLEEAKKELKKQNKKFKEDLKVGVMIEVPSAALISDILAKYADFFSIGTNDLIQYSLAVDRADEKVAYLYEPAHPAVLRLIKRVVDAAHTMNIEVSMCGEMASEPIFIFLLIGMGLDELSMPPSLIPKAKLLIRSISYKEAAEVFEKVSEFSSPREVEDFCIKRLKEFLKEKYEELAI